MGFPSPFQRTRHALCLTALALTLAGPLAIAQHAEVAAAQSALPAVQTPLATQAMILGAARAGKRVVAVGDHGVVLLSDDDGKHFRQAKSVPTRAVLTAVSFSDAQNGWAVGHHGTILHTSDGGENWVLQRQDLSVDQPLFSVQFRDAQSGIAVGLWSLMLQTSDGGRTWRKQTLPSPPGATKADRNLFSVFTAPDGAWLVAAEQGLVLRSTDGGQNWSWLDTGYRGSLWAGTALHDGTLYVAGMRGTVYRSTDRGEHWEKVPSGTASSTTALVPVGSGAQEGVAGVGLEGVALHSEGLAIHAMHRPDRLDLTALVRAANGKLVMFSVHGVVVLD